MTCRTAGLTLPAVKAFQKAVAVVGMAMCVLFSAAQTRAAMLVDLDATGLPLGPLASWTNSGSLGGTFAKEIDTPSVTVVSGVRGITFDGTNDWYVGPVAPSSVTGNGSRSVIAWIYNPSIATEETVVAWGRRGGGNGTNASFTHGTHNIWGALGQWGDLADVSWNGAQESGIWTCLAFSYDGVNGVSAVYTNGKLSNSEVNGPLSTHAVSTSNAPLPIVVGCQNQANGTRDNSAIPASFTLAKLRVYDQALNPAEIATAYNADATVFGRAQATLILDFSAAK